MLYSVYNINILFNLNMLMDPMLPRPWLHDSSISALSIVAAEQNK